MTNIEQNQSENNEFIGIIFGTRDDVLPLPIIYRVVGETQRSDRISQKRCKECQHYDRRLGGPFRAEYLSENTRELDVGGLTCARITNGEPDDYCSLSTRKNQIVPCSWMYGGSLGPFPEDSFEAKYGCAPI